MSAAAATAAYLMDLPGLTPYDEGLALMGNLAGARSQQAIPDVLMLLEHEPVVTLGTRTDVDVFTFTWAGGAFTATASPAAVSPNLDINLQIRNSTGATVLTNLSASNITIGKAETRRLLCRSQSARCLAAYLYAAAGVAVAPVTQLTLKDEKVEAPPPE